MTKKERRQWIWEVIGQIITMTRTDDPDQREAQIFGFYTACVQRSRAQDEGDDASPTEELHMWLNVSGDFTRGMNQQLRQLLDDGPAE